ncbi:hypothetical protein COL60_10045 [Bacillus pseudomycoides]|nr:hypothetical protein COL60_10045 [Bacillus pseudomycoides]
MWGAKTNYLLALWFINVRRSKNKNTQELSKVLLRLFNLLQRNGRKSHRYEKKTVFDISYD